MTQPPATPRPAAPSATRDPILPRIRTADHYGARRELRDFPATDQAIRATPAVPLRRQPPAVPSTQRDVQNRPNLPGGRVMTAAPQADGEGVSDGR